MSKILIAAKKNFLKFSIFFVVIAPVSIFLNNGLQLDSYWLTLQAIVLSVCLTFVIVWPGLKKFFFGLGLLLILLMVFFYIARLIDLAEMAGSSGVGLIIVNLFAYLPQLVKLGYIKKL